jgi:hypothetical protein
MRAAVIALVVIIGVLGGFYGGYKVGQNNVSASAATSSNTRGSGGFGQGRGGALTAACPSPGATPSPGSQTFARGTISNLSSTSMTLSSTGCDVKVTFSPTTAVSKTVSGSTSDLSDNQTVTVTGTRQADGSILAQAVAVGGAGGVNRGPGAPAASPGAGG